MMRKNIIRICTVALLIAFAMSAAACSNANIYDKLKADGYDVKVIFEAEGAVVNETQNVRIVEVYDGKDTVTGADGKTGIRLIAPDDSVRGAATFKLAQTDATNNYFQAGWYRSKTARVDENGNALDAYGELTSVSGREQAYVYSDKWDFERDVVTEADLVDGEFTLYAAWIPFFTYEFYAKNAAGEFELISSKKKLTLTSPVWNERREEFTMNDFPKAEEGKVFAGAYLDEAMTEKIEQNIDGRELYVDYESGIASTTTVKIYIAWENAPAVAS